ncbi:MAG: hypothetical protein E7420_00095 [Ruminococcaceae bacterium]|nr:hypothetical protein [Oscillospiraceae bacterium]
MSEKKTMNQYPYRAPKKFPKKSLHGRVRSGYMLYEELERAQRFYVNVFGWDMFKLPSNVMGRYSPAETPDVCCATGPAQFGWEGAVPGYMPMIMIKKTDEDNKPFLMMEVEMDVSLQKTADRVVAAGGKLLSISDPKNPWAEVAMVEDPAGNRLFLWKCPDSRTWEEPETDYDRD